MKIEVLGPPPTSGTRDAFVELALEGGAEMVPELAALDDASNVGEVKTILAKLGLPDAVFTSFEQSKGKAPKGSDIFASLVHAIREDGAYIEAGENDNLIVQKLVANPAAWAYSDSAFWIRTPIRCKVLLSTVLTRPLRILPLVIILSVGHCISM